eukprot:1252064-Prymnesium_polylepis.2
MFWRSLVWKGSNEGAQLTPEGFICTVVRQGSGRPAHVQATACRSTTRGGARLPWLIHPLEHSPPQVDRTISTEATSRWSHDVPPKICQPRRLHNLIAVPSPVVERIDAKFSHQERQACGGSQLREESTIATRRPKAVHADDIHAAVNERQR